ncbi:MAG: hypothetical protein H6699_00155 [Myxococcales bacterium]|nr:hypothetical protein [Myxococcales bacterium]
MVATSHLGPTAGGTCGVAAERGGCDHAISVGPRLANHFPHDVQVEPDVVALTPGAQ